MKYVFGLMVLLAMAPVASAQNQAAADMVIEAMELAFDRALIDTLRVRTDVEFLTKDVRKVKKEVAAAVLTGPQRAQLEVVVAMAEDKLLAAKKEYAAARGYLDGAQKKYDETNRLYSQQKYIGARREALEAVVYSVWTTGGQEKADGLNTDLKSIITEIRLTLIAYRLAAPPPPPPPMPMQP